MVEPAPARNGAVFAVTATGEPNPWKKDLKTTKVPPQFMIAADQYTKIMEAIEKSGPVTMEVDIRNTYQAIYDVRDSTHARTCNVDLEMP